MSIKCYQVDAFTNEAFKGNPAAVCLLEQPVTDEWMQKVAAEMNLSETAFLLPEGDGYRLRWFTPVAEVDLCGHATLASAHTLWESGQVNLDQDCRFNTNSGILTASRKDDWIELNFPSEPVEETACPKDLLEGLGVKALYIGKNRFDYLVEVDSEETVRNLNPNWSVLEKVETRGILVTSRSQNSDYDFISRAFFPRIGINEDPVTGSAHCGLGPYWQEKLNKADFYAYQASSRGGVLKVNVRDNRTLLAGQAVTVMKGEILG